MKRSTSLNEIVRTSGIALFVSLIVSVGILALSPTDSGQRGFAHGAVNAVCWLYVLWTSVAAIAVARRHAIPNYFWLVFTFNVLITVLLLVVQLAASA